MQTALIRFARALDFHDLADTTTPRQVFSRTAFLKQLRKDAVVIDHDDDRVVGRIVDLVVTEDMSNGAQPMLWHIARVEGDFPPWVRKGTGASFRHRPIHSMNYGAVESVQSAILDEITICSPSHEPVDPLAQVTFLRTLDAPLASATSSAGRAHHRPADDLENRLAREWAAAAPRGVIRRVNIGQVLSVR